VTGVAIGLAVVATVAAVADWIAVVRHDERLERVAKPLALAALTGVALTLDPSDPTVRTWFVVALVASLAGDVLLMLPSDRFVAGLAAFLVAHLAYVGGFLAAGVTPLGMAAGLAAVAVVLGAIGPMLVRGVRRSAPEMTVPVGAYMVVISAMVVTAAGTGDAVAIAGAGLFYASDGLIGLTRFVRPAPWGPVAVMVTYHAGQALLVASLV
jgi:uncharacterized membrane protein YhhN